MSEEEEQFHSRNISWICEKLIVDEKVRDHCISDHCNWSVIIAIGKFGGAANWSCNKNLQLTKNVPVIFHNLRGYDSHLIFDVLNKFNVKIDIIQNRIEKYVVFFLNKTLVFIDSMQLMNSSLEKLAKNLSMFSNI